MRQFAANLSGVNQTELLDPVINLFLESLSEEIYKIAGEIDNIENRILDKLSSILVPTLDTIAKPAYCIMHASSQNVVTDITAQSGFQYYNGKQNLSFYPVCNTRVYNGRIAYFIHKESVYTIERDLSRTLYYRSHQKNSPDKNNFWIGLDLNENIENICGLSFYFDFHGVFDKDKYLNLLPHTTWSIQGKKIPVSKGIFSSKDEYENITLELFAHNDLSNKINKSVKKHYNNCFLSIDKDCFIKDKKEPFPKELTDSFPENLSTGINKPLVWIKVTCPQEIAPEMIDLIQLDINAFPVVNKGFVSKIIRIKKTTPVIPLDTGNGESFISVHNVIDSSGKRYYDFPVKNTSTQSYGVYALRRGGIEHYDRRDAREYLINVINDLNREITSFFKDKDSIKNDLKRIETRINRLIRQLNKSLADNKYNYEIKNYLLLDPEKEDEVYFLDYWITNGTQANDIKSGVVFSILSDMALIPSSIYSLNRTTGGKYAPQASEKEVIYKKNLMSHNLLVTNEDIEKFCTEEFRESVKSVRVSKGFMKSDNPKFGFIETTDVYLLPIETMRDYMNEADKNYYLKALKEKSPATFNYRIFIDRVLQN
ncbi:type VI secretion system baseplate subunit TssF [Prevotella sp. 10(H)]|uniref:type VI secretion system baseplate subunit TssF n=1 Tax=Prevotella sp. 10(H) TaxID=1158294 RepID=UPI0012DEB1C1|nr:type VI secretion system baseplate subunit TssF [Prevotella sp. 10(H)]